MRQLTTLRENLRSASIANPSWLTLPPGDRERSDKTADRNGTARRNATPGRTTRPNVRTATRNVGR